MSNYPIVKNRRITTPIETILKQIKSELTNGKLSYIDSKSSGWIRITCPFHSSGLEKNPSAGIYNGDDPKLEKGFFHCFTCNENGPLYHFVGECFDRDDNFGKQWLIDRFGGERVEDEDIHLPYISLNKKENNAFLNESLLDNFQSWHPYMNKRKLTQDVCNRFKVKYDPKEECIIFPVWDENSNLVMLTKRSVNSKMFYIDKDKEKPIYLLNFIKQENIKEVCVCESQINALTLWSWNIPAIATFGCNITKHQFDILNKSEVEHYYLCFDGDEAGKKGIEKFLNYIRKDVLVDIIYLPKGKDVNDLTEEEFDKLKILNKLNCII